MMTDEHKRKLREGRVKQAAADRANGGAKPKQKREKKAKVAGGRFSCDELGSVTILEADLKHGLTLDATASANLRDFLDRALSNVEPIRFGTRGPGEVSQ